ncbi:hypothetical protein HYH03_011031 [Edaphochlamys debaryana]|uniref:Uncharacterized protein n=1 Tax=Edaphochlamys debaryana TaxID=47281 RepID=A0A835Y154_9CHLO|nr:hypothetical protein HYH03_011031 [Edaphochlamys debaryana]|eukprot:KAG2490640.1 hypothetical protein HYH03_011031 [Edaphochlamys debaryana]
MGCAAAKLTAGARSACPATDWHFPPPGKRMEDWDPHEVACWFRSLDLDMQRYGEALVPEAGCVVVHVWNLKFLVGRGVPEPKAQRLLAARDVASAGASGRKAGPCEAA